MICRGCNYKKTAPEGICDVKKGSEGLLIRRYRALNCSQIRYNCRKVVVGV